eukprot:CAMPEP_0172329858 /NCGR_PEP_ID=MMETSP1058-20130122/61097_1 /TAXON_ID=83371 /ORGANISM="Detonula confervacea, Strain CCMP 353" /LENGTH=125 /DNA_ID=CAMNT_0013047051 /DNA_START=121 /DNA_END=501 /DNA_ORIENTATION=+
MNSLEITHQLRRIFMDSKHCASPPPESLSSSLCPHELDRSGLDGMSPSPSLASSYNSLSSQESQSSYASRGVSTGLCSTLSRSRCVNNLSSLCSTSSECTSSSRQIPPYESGPNEGYGYFIDTSS